MLLLLALGAASVGFTASLDANVVRDPSLGIGLGDLCIVSWFVLIPVIMWLFGMYDPSFPKLTKITLIWWIKYTLSFVSVFLSLVGASVITKLTGPGLGICQLAAFFWFLTYIAFTFENKLMPRWLDR
jgi:hypothetical protein